MSRFLYTHIPLCEHIDLSDKVILRQIKRYCTERISNCFWIWQKDFMHPDEVISSLFIWVSESKIDNCTTTLLIKRCNIIIQNEWVQYIKNYYPYQYEKLRHNIADWHYLNKDRIKKNEDSAWR